MGWLSKDRSVEVINNNLTNAFYKVRYDIEHLNNWINYLHNKHSEIESKNDAHKINISSEIHNLQKWINYLNDSIEDLYKYLEKNNELLNKLEAQNKEVIERLSKIESQGHLRTSHGTYQGHVKDVQNGFLVEKTSTVDISTLTQSEQEVLNVLYAADRPLGYKDISKMLNKEEKSIRNLVYELRKKKIEVRDKSIGLREKGFFLTKEERIRISGR